MNALGSLKMQKVEFPGTCTSRMVVQAIVEPHERSVPIGASFVPDWQQKISRFFVLAISRVKFRSLVCFRFCFLLRIPIT